MIMKRPNETASSVHHLRFSSANRRALTRLPPLLASTNHASCASQGSANIVRAVSEFIWAPSPELVAQANVTRVARKLECADFGELHALSVDDPARFWPAVVEDLGLRFSAPWERVIIDRERVEDRKSTRLNSSHTVISYAVFCLKKKRDIK